MTQMAAHDRIARPECTAPHVLESCGAACIDIADVSFGWAAKETPDLEIGSLRVQGGERLFIQGPSGSGKTTLLSLLGGMIAPQQGTIAVLGERLDEMGAAARDRFRADHIGYIFQMFNLVPYLTVLENVTLPLRFSESRRAKASRETDDPTDEARRLLSDLGMGDDDLLRRTVTELSVGQQQRAAAARALIGSPELLIADEPTSALDAANREAFIELLLGECSREGTTLVFVSHDSSLAPLFDRTVTLGREPSITDAKGDTA